MRRLEEILEFNKSFVENKEYEKYKATKKPEKISNFILHGYRLILVITKGYEYKKRRCKDNKKMLGLQQQMHPFGSIVRQFVVIYEFNAEDVLIVGHHGCGMRK